MAAPFPLDWSLFYSTMPVLDDHFMKPGPTARAALLLCITLAFALPRAQADQALDRDRLDRLMADGMESAQTWRRGWTAFFAGSAALELGAVPKLNSTVTAYGYPIGGQRMSITRGVVSRIEFRAYAHSGLDQHLTVQVDAAINPGNSGGPIVQDGKVVGVAFQSYRATQAQNTGYMIPTPVIRRMLEDCRRDGAYDGYVELAVFHTNLLNQAFRSYLELPDDDLGIWVREVMKDGSADGVIKAGDVLRKVDGHPITNTGSIRLDGELVQMEEIVERKFHGDTVNFDLIRAGEPKRVSVPLKGSAAFRVFAHQYDHTPRYVLFAGMLFQPMSRNVLAAHKIKDPDIQFTYSFFIRDGIYLERPEPVLLTAILPDRINAPYKKFQHSLVDRVNGVEVGCLRDLVKGLEKSVEHVVITLQHHHQPIVIQADQVIPANARIGREYQVGEQQNLEED